MSQPPPPLPGQEVFVFQTPAGTVSRDCLHSVLTRFFQRDSFTRFFILVCHDSNLSGLLIHTRKYFWIWFRYRGWYSHVQKCTSCHFPFFLSQFKETVYQIFNPFSWFKLIWIHGLRQEGQGFEDIYYRF